MWKGISIVQVFYRIMVCLAVLVLVGSSGWSQSEKQDRAASPDVETVLEFAREHHPELAKLLKRLKTADRSAFQRAIEDLSRAQKRLTRLKAHDAERYELALRVWSLDSRIRLLVARSTMNDSIEAGPRLRKLLKDRQQARLKLFHIERQRMRARLERINQQISRIEDDPEQAIEHDLARIQRDMKSAKHRGEKPKSERPKRSSRGDQSDAKQRNQ